MGQELAISILAIEDDRLPDWLDWLIKKGLGKVAGLVADWAGGGSLAQQGAGYVGRLIGEALDDWLGENEQIGLHLQKFTRTQNWGLGQHEVRAGNMTVRYTIQRVTPPTMRVSVFLRAVITHDDSDTGSGECYLVARAATYFERLAALPFREPSSETRECSEEAGDGSHIWRLNQPLLTNELVSPFLYVEVAFLEGEDAVNPLTLGGNSSYVCAYA